MCRKQNEELGNGMREMGRIRARIRGMGWDCGFEESAWVCGESECKCKKCGVSAWRCWKSKWKLNYSGRNDIE